MDTQERKVKAQEIVESYRRHNDFEQLVLDVAKFHKKIDDQNTKFKSHPFDMHVQGARLLCNRSNDLVTDIAERC